MKSEIANIFKKLVINISKIIIFFCFGIILVVIIGLVAGWYLVPLQPISLSQDHINFIGYINRIQQVHFIENMKFNDDIHILNAPYNSKEFILEKLKTYDYDLEAKNNLAFVYAIPKNQYHIRKILEIELVENKNKPFYGYVGAVLTTDEDNQTMDSIICKNNTIGTIKPNKPILKDNSLVCSKGTREVD